MEEPEIIFSYTLQDAIDDGVLAEVLKHRWPELTGGKPLVASAKIMNQISLAGIIEIWNEFVRWRETNPEDKTFYKTKMNEQEVWLIEDGQALTVMYPSDY
ncbi:hypothetical protein ACFL52_00985 [Candidatus Margulisiibacteriota bacterium]